MADKTILGAQPVCIGSETCYRVARHEEDDRFVVLYGRSGFCPERRYILGLDRPHNGVPLRAAAGGSHMLVSDGCLSTRVVAQVAEPADGMDDVGLVGRGREAVYQSLGEVLRSASPELAQRTCEAGQVLISSEHNTVAHAGVVVGVDYDCIHTLHRVMFGHLASLGV